MDQSEFNFTHDGTCPVCERKVTFSAKGPYFRSTLKCPHCNTVPRHRAVFQVLKSFCPNWRKAQIHESSPGWDFVSQRLINECPGYTSSQFDRNVALGTVVNNDKMPGKKYRCEDLEKQTFPDESFDIVLAQDVFEHLFDPAQAIKEIARTLKPDGVFVSTVPITLRGKPSRKRAVLRDDKIVHLLPAEYHGNPVDKDGALVTVDWGLDIVPFLQHHSGLAMCLVQIDNLDLGIKGTLTDVLVGIKKPLWELHIPTSNE